MAPPGFVRYPGRIGQRFTDLNVSLGSAASRTTLPLLIQLFAATAGKVKAPKAGKENARVGRFMPFEPPAAAGGHVLYRGTCQGGERDRRLTAAARKERLSSRPRKRAGARAAWHVPRRRTYFLGFGFFFLSLQPHELHIAALLNEVPGGLSLPPLLVALYHPRRATARVCS